MKILGIETSCDETAAAVLENGRILSNVVASQAKLHEKFGGVVPELASNQHLKTLIPCIERALRRAGCKLSDIDRIAVTQGPGLPGALLAGVVAARTLSRVFRIPLFGIHHIEGHILSASLFGKLKPPFLALIVSGGHTELINTPKWGRYRILGRTRDDALGEAFDKVAKLLGLGYPGGPRIEVLARKGARTAIPFPRPHLPGSWDFSFSGIKTAVANYVRGRRVTPKLRADIAASFQEAVFEVIVKKALAAARFLKMKKVVVAGGVAANRRLRELFQEASGMRVIFPPMKFCTDNAAMIAAACALHPAPSGNGKVLVTSDKPLTSWR